MRNIRNVAAVSVVACAALMYSGTAWASPGCDLINSGGADISSGSVAINGLVTGDQLSFVFTTLSNPGSRAGFNVLNQPFTTVLKDSGFLVAPASDTFNYTVTGTGDTSLRVNVDLGAGAPQPNLAVTCIPGSSESPQTSSQLLDETRKRFSKAAAQVSIANVSESVTGAIGDAFGSGGSTQIADGRISTSFAALDNAANNSDKDNPNDAYAALGYDKDMVRKASPRIAPSAPYASPWHAWIDARYTALDSKRVSTFDAHHTNATGGLSYRFNDFFLAGLVVGYEDFNYELGFSNAKLDGNGWNGGGYFGWKFWDRLRLDGMLTYGRISYGAQADNVTAGFDADRITGMLRLSGRWALAAGWYAEPSARIIYANERQDAFTDTAGVVHSKYDFDVGLASIGGEVGAPVIFNSWIVTPTVGLYGDYRFGDDTVATVATLPNLDDGWSARVTGGLRWTAANGFTSSLGGEYGGLGSDTRFWRAKGSVGVKF